MKEHFPKSIKCVLNNFSLEIKGGQKVAILGNSGNGKSTLIKLIMGYYKPQTGQILIDNQNNYEFYDQKFIDN